MPVMLCHQIEKPCHGERVFEEPPYVRVMKALRGRRLSEGIRRLLVAEYQVEEGLEVRVLYRACHIHERLKHFGGVRSG
ncbi:hypothetical protein ES708_07316 [subsurface metagenome]